MKDITIMGRYSASRNLKDYNLPRKVSKVSYNMAHLMFSPLILDVLKENGYYGPNYDYTYLCGKDKRNNKLIIVGVWNKKFKSDHCYVHFIGF